MTAEMQPDTQPAPPVETSDPDRPRIWWFALLAVLALALAVGAWFYRQSKQDDVKKASAQSVVLGRATRALEAKVATAKTTLAASRLQLQSKASRSASFLQVLDQLDSNHKRMSGYVHDQNAASAQIVDALAASDFGRYNNLADQFTNSTRSVNSLADTETKLQQDLSASTVCTDSCIYSEDASAGLPSHQHGSGDARTRFLAVPARWGLRYDFQCPASASSGYFDVVVNRQDGSFIEGGVSLSTLSGRGVVDKQGPAYPASILLEVHSNCAWNITVSAG